MFDHVTNEQAVARPGSRALIVLASAAVQAGVVRGLLLLASASNTQGAEEPLVPVKLVRTAPQAVSAAPMAAASGPRPVRRRPVAEPRPAPTLVEPRTIPTSPPEPNTPEEEALPASDTSGAVLGSADVSTEPQPAPAPATPAPPPPPAEADEPTYAGIGFVRPRLADGKCVQTHLEIPRGLEGLAVTVTAKFAIAMDGAPSLFSVGPSEVDGRLATAIWEAVRACRWIPGMNAHGRPTRIWVLMPFRFQAN